MKRYDLSIYDPACMDPEEDGDWVKYDDAEKQHEELKEALAKIEKLEDEVDSLNCHIQEMDEH